MATYKIICCNCFFDSYLIEINKDAQMLKVRQENLTKFIRLREKLTNNGKCYVEWHHFYNDRIFHACYKCIFTVLLVTTFRRYDFVHCTLGNNCASVMFDRDFLGLSNVRTCLRQCEYIFAQKKIIGSQSFCHSCQFELCFKIINCEFNCLDSAFIIKKLLIFC